MSVEEGLRHDRINNKTNTRSSNVETNSEKHTGKINMSKENTTIQISRDTKKLLDKLKVIPEESNESVLKRILAKQK